MTNCQKVAYAAYGAVVGMLLICGLYAFSEKTLHPDTVKLEAVCRLNPTHFHCND